MEQQVCDIHYSKYSFCFVHRITCCAECHGNTYDGCKIEDLTKAIAHFKLDIRSNEEDMRTTRGPLCEVSMVDMCNDKEKHLISEISKYFDAAMALVDKCKLKAIQQVKDNFLKKHTMGTQYDKSVAALCGQIDIVSREISQGNILDVATCRKESSSGAHEGAAACDEGGSLGTPRLSSVDLKDDAKLVDRLSTISIRGKQVLSNSRSQIENINTLSRSLSELTFQTDGNMLDSLRSLLDGSCKLADGTIGKLMCVTPNQPADVAPTNSVPKYPTKPAHRTRSTPNKPVHETPTKPAYTTPAKPVNETPTEPVGITIRSAKSAYGIPTKPVDGNPTKPVFGNPTKPVYGNPTKPVYGNPTKPVHGTPAKPVYVTPVTPVYGTPAKPVYEPATKPVYATPTAATYRTPTAATYGPHTAATYGPPTEATYGPLTAATYGPPTAATYGPPTAAGYGTPTAATYGPPSEPVDDYYYNGDYYDDYDDDYDPGY